jgi:hypothetical protein
MNNGFDLVPGEPVADPYHPRMKAMDLMTERNTEPDRAAHTEQAPSEELEPGAGGGARPGKAGQEKATEETGGGHFKREAHRVIEKFRRCERLLLEITQDWIGHGRRCCGGPSVAVCAKGRHLSNFLLNYLFVI